uniref:serine/threonine-protein kinase n=1 Tax=Paractinoplanes globisporus TaxID=113565 RepID=UPI00351CD2B0
MSSSPPAVVADRYRLVAPLGQGGMGRVWRANDVVLHRDVAIKELVPPPGLTPDERKEMRERSLREARAIARLNNINVVRVFDVLQTDADPWIVMEYVPSRSLQDTLAADGPFNAVRVAEIGLGVLGALRAAHRAGVVHRDVKPGNVLLGADGRVVLTDFGLATVPGDPNVTRTGLVLGSPAYIAPERARDGTAGPAADLWSLGATLYAAVEGASPFARPSAIATLAALATENPPPARNAGPLKPVLNGLLRKDPTHRINAEEAERLLNRAAGRRSKLAFPMSPTMRRPGVGRDRLGGSMAPTGSTPVVPGPRPPVAPARPVDPPGRPPVSGGRPAAGEGRPPVYVPGKAPVGRTGSDTPAKVDGPKAATPRLDATRVDTPPVQDDKTSKISGARTPGRPPASGPSRRGSAEDSPSTRTSRGEAGSFTAADVAAHHRGKAAPEHEQSLAEATALVSPVETPPVEATTVVGPVVEATTVVPPPVTADATTVVDAPRQPRKKAATKQTPSKKEPVEEKAEAASPPDAAVETPAAETTEAEPEDRAEEGTAEAETAEQEEEEKARPEPPTDETEPGTEPEPETKAETKNEAETEHEAETQQEAELEQEPEPTPSEVAPVSPAISRSTRPAWRPMDDVRPAARGGITVFGTRLTYPQAGIGAGVLLVVVVLLIVLAAKAFGTDDNPGNKPNAAPTATGAAQPSATGSAAQSATTGGASQQPSNAASSAPPSSPPAALTLPAGWKMYTQRATGDAPAFTIPIPNGAEISNGTGSAMEFRWSNRLLIVDRTNSPQADAYQDWKNQEASRRGSYRNYSRIRIDRVQYRDYDSAADWEFTYTSSSGNAQHALKRNIRVDANAAYSLSWYTTPEDWARSQSDLQLLYQGFQPK